ncbi:hypothetical protein [Actinoplanes solisilvae]|uniref:hypothetical protein n=1 Tax=Actinoplanes solisilvae TaxID=2486853 RepID=UPI000FDCB3B2|nr:hypothetical protein [Actinoplanes solisilvae]
MQSLALLQTVSGLLVTDVVLTCVDRIGQIEVWPGAVFVLLNASTRRHRRGALVAWVAVVPALVAGFALRGELLSSIAPAALLLVLAVTSADQASRLARTRTRLDVAEEALRRHAENDSLTGLIIDGGLCALHRRAGPVPRLTRRSDRVRGPSAYCRGPHRGPVAASELSRVRPRRGPGRVRGTTTGLCRRRR